MKEIVKENIVTGSELVKLVGNTFGEIKAMIEKNGYQVSNQKALDVIMKGDLKSSLGNASYKTIKKVNRAIRWWSLRPNRHTANRFIHLLRTRVYGKLKTEYYQTRYESSMPSVKITLSIKEELIQKKRQVWKKLRDEAEKARLDYKKEKGDFYKSHKTSFIEKVFVKKEKELV